MTTTTARYGLTKINVLSDNVDVVADFNNNWDAIDLKLGTQVCTSSTRPASPVQGMNIYETDTGYVRVYTGSAWKTAGNAVSTSSARPASPIQGDLLFESDTGYVRKYNGTTWTGVGEANATSGSLPANPVQADLVYLNDIGAVAYYSGGAWHTCTLIVCTSTTRPTGSSLQTGSFIYETDTTRLLVYNGTSWVPKTFGNFVCTSTTHPSWAFQGLEIYETDTGLNAVYNGTNYLYGLQQLAPTQSVSAASSVTFSGIPPVNRVVLIWRLRSSTGGAVFSMQIDGDTTSGHYIWAKMGVRAAAVSGSGNAGDTAAQIGTVAGNGTANYFTSGVAFVNGWNSTNGYTNIVSSSSAWDTTSSYWIENQGSLFIGSTVAHTSLKVLPNSGTITGEVTIYGGP
jgi:hypothetical protein